MYIYILVWKKYKQLCLVKEIIVIDLVPYETLTGFVSNLVILLQYFLFQCVKYSLEFSWKKLYHSVSTLINELGIPLTHFSICVRVIFLIF